MRQKHSSRYGTRPLWQRGRLGDEDKQGTKRGAYLASWHPQHLRGRTQSWSAKWRGDVIQQHICNHVKTQRHTQDYFIQTNYERARLKADDGGLLYTVTLCNLKLRIFHKRGGSKTTRRKLIINIHILHALIRAQKRNVHPQHLQTQTWYRVGDEMVSEYKGFDFFFFR